MKERGNNGTSYFDEEANTNKTTDEILMFPKTSDVISCYYYPYINYNGLSTEDVYFDYEAYPQALDTEQLQKDLILHRINHMGTNTLTTIGRFPKYPVKGTTLGGEWNWRNEGKLWLPPFTTCFLYDGLTEPMFINPLLFKNDLDSFAVSVRHSLNHLGAYTLYVEGYRGDNGRLYGLTCSGLNMPLTTNAYTEFMHKNQFTLRNNRWKNCLNGMVGVVSGMVNGDLGQVANTTLNTYTNHLATKNTIAQTKLSGYQLTNEGSNTLHDFQFYSGFRAIYMQYLEEHMEQVGLYLHQYGYAQQRLMIPNLKSRKYFNYIKTTGCNLKGQGIPKSSLNKLKELFNKGFTIWHMDNASNFIGNYTPDNVER